jgi:hypothetical protein
MRRASAGAIPRANHAEGSVGEMSWSGVGGTTFWGRSEGEHVRGVHGQTVTHRTRIRTALKNMVYGTFEK